MLGNERPINATKGWTGTRPPARRQKDRGNRWRSLLTLVAVIVPPVHWVAGTRLAALAQSPAERTADAERLAEDDDPAERLEPEPAGDLSDASPAETPPSRPPADRSEIPSLFPGGRGSAVRETAGEVTAGSDRSAPGVAVPDQWRRWIDALGADEFSVRERAAANLRKVGLAVLPELRRVAESSNDPEVRARAADLARIMTEGALNDRIDTFLSGGNPGFEGWEVARAILGDSPVVRELFVDLLRDHPDVVASLAGSAAERKQALEGATAEVQRKMRREFRPPSSSDLIALLLPANDPNVELSATVESTLLSVLRMHPASELLESPQLAPAATALIGGWVRRTGLGTRDQVLWFAMSRELEDALPVAVETLRQANNPETLTAALQAIAQFGSEKDIAAVEPLLGDQRMVSQRGLGPGNAVFTRLGDVAMATIAILGGLDLTEAGFSEAAEHPRFGFLPEEIGFPKDRPEARQKVRARIDRLIEGTKQGKESGGAK